MGDLFILTALKINDCCHKENLTAMICILCEDSCDEVKTYFSPFTETVQGCRGKTNVPFCKHTLYTEWISRMLKTPYFSSVQFCHSVMTNYLWPHGLKHSQSLLKLMYNESVMPSNHLILCHPVLLPPSIFPSIRVFSSESVLHIR